MKTGGVNSKKGCFGRKTKFFWESEDFVGIGEAWENFRGKRSGGVQILGNLRVFWECLPKISGRYSTFLGGLLFRHGSAPTAFVRAVIPHNEANNID